MSHDTALLDANVLYPAPLRDLFLQLAVTDIFKAKWSADIHREWIEALLRNEPQRDRAVLERTRDLMDKATRDSLVSGYEPLIAALSLPDPDDRHVLAAAIAGRCDAIVIQNPRGFSRRGAGPLHRARLINPPYSIEEYLAILTRQGLVASCSPLQTCFELGCEYTTASEAGSQRLRAPRCARARIGEAVGQNPCSSQTNLAKPSGMLSSEFT